MSKTRNAGGAPSSRASDSRLFRSIPPAAAARQARSVSGVGLAARRRHRRRGSQRRIRLERERSPAGLGADAGLAAGRAVDEQVHGPQQPIEILQRNGRDPRVHVPRQGRHRDGVLRGPAGDGERPRPDGAGKRHRHGAARAAGADKQHPHPVKALDERRLSVAGPGECRDGSGGVRVVADQPSVRAPEDRVDGANRARRRRQAVQVPDNLDFVGNRDAAADVPRPRSERLHQVAEAIGRGVEGDKPRVDRQPAQRVIPDRRALGRFRGQLADDARHEPRVSVQPVHRVGEARGHSTGVTAMVRGRTHRDGREPQFPRRRLVLHAHARLPLVAGVDRVQQPNRAQALFAGDFDRAAVPDRRDDALIERVVAEAVRVRHELEEVRLHRGVVAAPVREVPVLDPVHRQAAQHDDAALTQDGQRRLDVARPRGGGRLDDAEGPAAEAQRGHAQIFALHPHQSRGAGRVHVLDVPHAPQQRIQMMDGLLRGDAAIHEPRAVPIVEVVIRLVAAPAHADGPADRLAEAARNDLPVRARERPVVAVLVGHPEMQAPARRLADELLGVLRAEGDRFFDDHVLPVAEGLHGARVVVAAGRGDVDHVDFGLAVHRGGRRERRNAQLRGVSLGPLGHDVAHRRQPRPWHVPDQRVHMARRHAAAPYEPESNVVHHLR